MKHAHSNPQATEPPMLLCFLLWAQIGMHVICGVCTLSFIFPFLDRQAKDQKIQIWSRHLLKIFNIELAVKDVSLLKSGPCLIVSNHISWLDIHVINAFKPIRFVAKSEVRGWPIFGWMAAQLGTVFIRRDSARHARQVVDQLAQVLQSESICIFPEGTSTAGETVLPFKPNLFESAVLAQAPVYPLAISYISKVTGERSDEPAFIGDMGLLESMSNVIKNRSLVAQITILTPLMPTQIRNMDRKSMAGYCQEAIAKTL